MPYVWNQSPIKRYFKLSPEEDGLYLIHFTISDHRTITLFGKRSWAESHVPFDVDEGD